MVDLSTKKARTTESLSEPLVMNNIDTSFILNDTIDDSVVTLALQVPEDMHLTAYIIGPKGVNVINIGKISGTKVQIERVGARGADQYRHMFIMGPLKGVLHAYQLIQEHVSQKVASFPAGTCDVTRVVIPNDVVAHVIGRGGHLIKELSVIASIQRIDIQLETEMNRMFNGFYGRSVTVLGEFANRLHAVYLLLRQLVQDRSLPSAWVGESVPVQYPAGGQGGGMNQGFPPQGGMGGPPQQGGMGGYGGGQMGYGGPQAPPRNPGQLGGDTKVDINVPSEKACLGHVIGPKGMFIDEMQRNSGCLIKIDKETPPGMNPNERRVQVSGPGMPQISHAIEMIQAKVEEWKRNYQQAGGQLPMESAAPKSYWDEPAKPQMAPQQQYGAPPQGNYGMPQQQQQQQQYPQQGMGQQQMGQQGMGQQGMGMQQQPQYQQQQYPQQGQMPQQGRM
mmetsp:Transcript_24426/g.23468  ORF Transcript_24426/g.23468 Transcript_24426/m.23468 type:complete len:449 (+) Transcript_24426:207-1553(+)